MTKSIIREFEALLMNEQALREREQLTLKYIEARAAFKSYTPDNGIYDGAELERLAMAECVAYSTMVSRFVANYAARDKPRDLSHDNCPDCAKTAEYYRDKPALGGSGNAARALSFHVKRSPAPT